ncbi:MAG: hypothetical protein JOZ27_06125, partial [Caulobacteraceae bacterium]|nr:hypothetical protein [Caulobacteraceae bacterium]
RDHLRVLRIKAIPEGGARFYGVFLEDSPRHAIGHYVVVTGKNGVTDFYDGLALEPEHQHRWAEAMEAALADLGPGRYSYGDPWSLEPSRAETIKALGALEVEDCRECVTQAVMFSNWPSWEAYYRSTSENSRANARRAAAKFPDIKVRFATRMAAIPAIVTLTSLRKDTYERKSLGFSRATAAARYAAKSLISPSQAKVAYVTAGGKVRAAMELEEFGPVTCYRSGGSARDADGAAWFLTFEVLKAAYEADPNGVFVMGYYRIGDDIAPGLVRSRRSVRVTDRPSSTIVFTWLGDGASSGVRPPLTAN